MEAKIIETIVETLKPAKPYEFLPTKLDQIGPYLISPTKVLKDASKFGDVVAQAFCDRPWFALLCYTSKFGLNFKSFLEDETTTRNPYTGSPKAIPEILDKCADYHRMLLLSETTRVPIDDELYPILAEVASRRAKGQSIYNDNYGKTLNVHINQKISVQNNLSIQDFNSLRR